MAKRANRNMIEESKQNKSIQQNSKLSISKTFIFLVIALFIGVMVNTYFVYGFIDGEIEKQITNTDFGEVSENLKPLNAYETTDGKIDLEKSIIKDKKELMNFIQGSDYYKVTIEIFLLVTMIFCPTLISGAAIYEIETKWNISNQTVSFIIYMAMFVFYVMGYLFIIDMFQIEKIANVINITKTQAYTHQGFLVMIFSAITFSIEILINKLWLAYKELNTDNQLKILIPVITLILGYLLKT